MTLSTRKTLASLWTLSGVIQWILVCYMAGWWGWWGLSALVCFLIAGNAFNTIREEETIHTYQTMDARLKLIEEYKQRLSALSASPQTKTTDTVAPTPFTTTGKRRAH